MSFIKIVFGGAIAAIGVSSMVRSATMLAHPGLGDIDAECNMAPPTAAQQALHYAENAAGVVYGGALATAGVAMIMGGLKG